MPDTPEPPADNIAPLLRLGLEEEPEMADPNATIMVTAPAPRTGSSGQSGGGSRGWSPPSVEELQQALPQYEISAFIARGGMGAVYKGMQKTLKRAVAIKVLPPEMGDDTGDLQFAARFKHEAQAMAQLSHPNIVAVFDAGEVVLGETLRQGEGETGRAGGVLLYFVMEFIEGTDVAQLIASEGMVEPRRAIQITTAVCEALAFAHEEGIIHRDIKPSNIMLDRKGRVKVADFGLAKTVSLDATLLTGTNLAMGTPDFIAPEAMIPGIKVDGRADLYAVGVMLYQMLTGTIPRGRFELPSGVVPQMNKGFDAVVDKAMQTDREKRYSTAMEMKKDVESVAAAPHPLPQAVPPTSDSSRQGGEAAKPKGRDEGGKVAKSHKHLIALGAAAALGFGGWMLWQGGAAGPPAAAETAKAALGGPSALPKAPAPPQAAWVPMYRQTAELAPLFGKPQTLYLDFQSHAALVQDPASGLKLADGWLTPTTTTHVKLPLPSARNAGVRMRVQMSEPTHTASIWLRGVDRGAVYAASWRGINRYFSTASKAAEYLAERKNFVAKKPGESFTLEFYAIGQDLIFRYDGEVIRVREPGEDPAIGTLNHLMIRNPVTDIEFINLDGLSESEALKLAGVDSAGAPIGRVPGSASGPPAAVPSNPGRLEGTGTMANGKTLELVKFDAYEDFVDVAGSADFLVALRANGEMVSSDGKADFTGIRKIARSFLGCHCFITETGELLFHPSREMPLPSSLRGRKVVDAACGDQHAVALLEGGQAVVFGPRYEGAVNDMSKRDGLGTPRWPQPEAAALQNVKGVAVTYTHAATLHEDGTVSVWGWEGPVKWQPEAKMKPVRQISSHHDSLHLLDEAGQVWSLPLPRSAHPEQPVGFNGTVKPLGTAAVWLRDHLWLGADGVWHGVAADRPVQELLERTDLQPETTFALLSSTASAIPFGYALWIEPGAPAGATVSPSPSLPVSTSLPPFTDREAAEWVLGLGQDTCSVTVRTLNGGKVTQVRKLADLPAEPFVIVEFKGSVLHTKSPELWGKVTDAVVLRLAGLRSLQLVDLRGNVTGASLKVMAHHPGLEALQFEGRNLKAGDLLHLRASRLQSLGIPLLRVAAPDSLAVLATMPNLRVLQFNESFDPALAAALPKLPKLEILRANSSDTLTDDVLPLLAERLPQLTLLQLWSSQKLKGSTLGSLTALKDLTTLGLTDTSVNDETLAQIAGMPQILSLELGQTRITDACLPTLKSFPKLESMHIFQTELTDAALLELASIPTLKKLVVKTSGYSDYKPKVTFTEAGIAAFQKLRPDVQVVK